MRTLKKMLNGPTIALIFLNCFILNSTLLAQTAMGIYLSQKDFNENKLSFKKESSRKCKIKLHNLSFKSNIKIICGDSAYQFSKDSVYGFKDQEGIAHRFFNKTVYTIINPNETILLYKVLAEAKTKYSAEIFAYYFSKDAASPVFPLKIAELERSFKDNTIFVGFLEVHFKNDDELLEYDQNHKTYKLNHLLELSKIKNN